MKTIIEPFRIRTVEPLRQKSPAERGLALERAHYNLFRLPARDVTIDLLTDSGTGAMSTRQWAAMMTADESYAGSESFSELEAVVREITGYRHVLPVHQGRAAERMICELLLHKGSTVPNNTHFDTTRANIEYAGARALDLPIEAASDPNLELPFKGDMDIDSLSRMLDQAAPGEIPFGMATVTNNAAGGQPVSMANLREISRLYRAHGIPFLLDAARFAENTFLIRQREPGYESKGLGEIAREMFSLADGCLISAKKDGLVNIGGLLALNDDALAERARNLLILTEGFPTYGGLAGRDLAAMAQGLQEVLDDSYLTYRWASVQYFADALQQLGVPTVRPPGLHAVYVDARQLLPHIPPDKLPGQAVCCELYRIGGIRAVEIGTLMFGGTDPISGEPRPAPMDLVRLCLPRRVYTQSHIDWVIEAFGELMRRRDSLPGYDVVKEAPFLRAFTAELRPVSTDARRTALR